MSISQTRTLEKRGLLVFTEEEKSAYLLRVFIIIEQTQRNLDENRGIIPYRGHYGWCTVMSGAYVCSQIQLLFQNQIIYEMKQDDIQNHIITSANLYEIADLLGEMSLEDPAPPNELFLPPPPYQPIFPSPTHLQFCFLEGVIATVISTFVPMYIPEEFEYEPFEEDPPLPPGGNKFDNPPPKAPPPSAPPTSGLPGSGAQFEISPPYDGEDDGGRTYVPPFLPPWAGDDGQDETQRYLVVVELTGYNADGTRNNEPPRTRIFNNVRGKILGLGTNEPNNPNGSYGVRTSNPADPLLSLGANYAFKVAWPYPEFTGYSVAKILQVLKQ